MAVLRHQSADLGDGLLDRVAEPRLHHLREEGQRAEDEAVALGEDPREPGRPQTVDPGALRVLGQLARDHWSVWIVATSRKPSRRRIGAEVS